MRATTCDHLTNTSLPAEQLNRLSAYIDAETIYGWNEDLLNELRDTSSGTDIRLIIFFLAMDAWKKTLLSSYSKSRLVGAT